MLKKLKPIEKISKLSLIVLICLSSNNTYAVSEQDMVLIKGGTFKPPYFITDKPVSYKVKSFYIDKTLVTNTDYLNFLRAKPEWRKSKIPEIYHDGKYLNNWYSELNYSPGKPKQPVTFVSWFAARSYCQWKGKRLPNELEWEFAAYEKNPDLLSWYWQPQSFPLPEVMHSKTNRLGVYDFHKLVWEWIGDYGSIMINNDNRVNGNKQEVPAFCGSTGNFKDKRDYAAFVRYSLRSTIEGSYTMANMGFRCAK